MGFFTSKTFFAAVTLGWTVTTPVSGLPQSQYAQRDATLHPVMQDNFADPAIITVDGKWYAFATTSAGANVPMASNQTGGSWAVLKSDSGSTQDAMPNLPGWCSGGIWAPDVVQRPDGQFVLYFSGSKNKDHHCIGVATSKDVTGPYDALPDPLACPLPAGAIDPSGFTDVDNTPYVVYKIDGNSLPPFMASPRGGGLIQPGTPLMLQKLNSSDYTTPIDDPVDLLNRGKNDGPLIEAPSLTRTGDGTYVLSFSSNMYNSEWYDTSYATSKKITGPYSKTDKPLLLPQNDKQPGTFGLMSPGGMEFGKDGKTVVFHADQKYKDASVRQMYVQTVSISGTTVSLDV